MLIEITYDGEWYDLWVDDEHTDSTTSWDDLMERLNILYANDFDTVRMCEPDPMDLAKEQMEEKLLEKWSA